MSTNAKKKIMDRDTDENLYDQEDEDTQKDRFLTFRLGEEDYGIEICHVTEIIGMQRITEVPDMPDFVKGVINLRGKVIPVLDVRLRFKMEAIEYTDRTCIIVVNIEDMAVGVVVDRVSEVMDIPESQVEPPPKVAARGATSRYIEGMGRVGEGVKILLDINKLLYDEELEQIKVEA